MLSYADNYSHHRRRSTKGDGIQEGIIRDRHNNTHASEQGAKDTLNWDARLRAAGLSLVPFWRPSPMHNSILLYTLMAFILV